MQCTLAKHMLHQKETGLPTQSPISCQPSEHLGYQPIDSVGKIGCVIDLASRLSEIQLKEGLLVEIHIQYIFICASHLK